MKSKKLSSQTYKGLVNIQVNKSSLEKAEETLILDLKNKALREWKSQLQTMNNKKVGHLLSILEVLYFLQQFIRPDKNAIARYNKDGLPRDLRSYYVEFIKKNGYREWSKRFNFGKRWLIEIAYSKFKRLFGETVKSKKEENIRQEFTLKIWIYNALIALQHGFKQIDYFFRFILYEYFILEKRITGQPISEVSERNVFLSITTASSILASSIKSIDFLCFIYLFNL